MGLPIRTRYQPGDRVDESKKTKKLQKRWNGKRGKSHVLKL